MLRKGFAFAFMLLFVGALLTLDYIVLSSNEVVTRMVREALEAKFGTRIRFEGARAGLGGYVTLSDVRFTLRNVDILKVREARIVLEGNSDRPREVELRDARLFLSDRVLNDLQGDPELQGSAAGEIPLISCAEGELEFANEWLFPEGRHPVFRIERVLLFKHSTGLLVGDGTLRHPELGVWRLNVRADGRSSDIVLATDELQFSEKTEALFSETFRRELDRCRPRGTAGVQIRVRDGRAAVTVTARDLSIQYVVFPYRVEHCAGEFEFRSDGFTIKNLTGEGSGGTISVQGQAVGYDYPGSFEFHVRMERVPMDARLYEALPPRAKQVVDAFAATGMIDAYARVFKNAGEREEIQVDLHLNFRDAHLNYRLFPYKLENASGELHLRLPKVEVKRVAAFSNGGQIELSGLVELTPDDMALDLNIRARGLPLDSKFRAALRTRPLELFDAFRVRGRIDADWHLTRAPGHEPRHEFVAAIVRGGCEFRACPIPFEDIEGFVDGVIDEPTVVLNIRDLSGRHEKAKVRLSGQWREDAAGSKVDLEVRAVGLDIHERLYSRMPREVAGVLSKLRLRGQTNLNGNYRRQSQGQSTSTSFTLALGLSAAALDLDVKMEEIEGRVWMTGSARNEEPVVVMGTADLSNARVQGKKLSRLSASFNFCNSSLNFLTILGYAYDGTVTGKFNLDTETGEYSGSFRASNIDLAELRLETEAYSKRRVSGRANVELVDLRGRVGDRASVRGKGKLQVWDGYLWEVPLFVKVFSLDPTKFAAKSQFDVGDVQFELTGGKINLDSVVFRSEDAILFGGGALDFDWNLDLRLKLESKILGDFWLFRPVDFIINNLSGAFWGIEVKGPFENPQVDWKLIPGLRK